MTNGTACQPASVFRSQRCLALPGRTPADLPVWQPPLKPTSRHLVTHVMSRSTGEDSEGREKEQSTQLSSSCVFIAQSYTA